MAVYDRWFPGPTSSEEYLSLGSLRDSIKSNVYAKAAGTGTLGFTGVPSKLWRPHSWSVVSGAIPWLGWQWNSSDGLDAIRANFRYSSILEGTLDPSSWFPAIFAPMSELPWDDFRHCAGFGNALASIAGKVFEADLCDAAPTTIGSQRNYGTNSSRTGTPCAFEFEGNYIPTDPEYSRGVRRSFWSIEVVPTDVDDGSVNILRDSFDIGVATSTLPVVVIEPGTTQDQGWQDLGTAVDGIGQTLEDWPDLLQPGQTLEDLFRGSERASEVEDPETVTAAADQASDPFTPLSVNPPREIFASPAVLPALVNTPSLIATVSKPAIIKVVSWTATAMAAAEAFSTGMISNVAAGFQRLVDQVFDKVVEIIDWLQDPTKPITRIAEATETIAQNGTGGGQQCETLCQDVARIAAAMEAIQAVLEGSEDPYRRGLINAIELASEARQELEVRVKGVLVQASTGGIIGFDEEEVAP